MTQGQKQMSSGLILFTSRNLTLSVPEKDIMKIERMETYE